VLSPKDLTVSRLGLAREGLTVLWGIHQASV